MRLLSARAVCSGLFLIGPSVARVVSSTATTPGESKAVHDTPARCELFDLPEPLRERLRRGLDGRAARYGADRTA